jgi:hypothetical protein
VTGLIEAQRREGAKVSRKGELIESTENTESGPIYFTEGRRSPPKASGFTVYLNSLEEELGCWIEAVL